MICIHWSNAKKECHDSSDIKLIQDYHNPSVWLGKIKYGDKRNLQSNKLVMYKDYKKILKEEKTVCSCRYLIWT